MATLLAFISLSQEQKAAALLTAELIATREEDDHYLFLYRLENYYAELSFDRKAGQIIDIVGFRARSRLMLYVIAEIT